MAGPLSVAHPWNLVAEGYDEYTRPMFEGFAARAQALLELGQGARVLDVACGPGTITLPLALEGHQVTAIDFAEAMLACLHRKLAPGGTHAGLPISVHLMDGQALGFPDASFDAAISLFGLMFFPDRGRGLRERHRVLAPGGRACISSWFPLSEVPALRWAFGALGAITPPNPNPTPRTPVLEDPQSIEQELRAAGFSEVDVTPCEHSQPFPEDLSEFWQILTKCSAPITLLRDQLGEERWAELSPKAIAHLRATVPTELGGQFVSKAWIAVARKAP